jgi:hypothetical protein
VRLRHGTKEDEMRVRTVVASLLAGLLSLAVLGSCRHSARPALSPSDRAAADEIAAGFLQSYGPLAGIGSDVFDRCLTPEELAGLDWN